MQKTARKFVAQWGTVADGKDVAYHITPDLVKLHCTALQIFILSCN